MVEIGVAYMRCLARCPLLVQSAKEATGLTRVASRPSRVNQDEECITVTVDTQFHHTLGVVAGRTFVPVRLAATAPEHGLAQGQRTRRLSSFIQAIINTWRVRASCTMAGTRPSFVKANGSEATLPG